MIVILDNLEQLLLRCLHNVDTYKIVVLHSSDFQLPYTDLEKDTEKEKLSTITKRGTELRFTSSIYVSSSNYDYQVELP